MEKVEGKDIWGNPLAPIFYNWAIINIISKEYNIPEYHILPNYIRKYREFFMEEFKNKVGFKEVAEKILQFERIFGK